MMAKQKLVMLADTERCVNCKACEVACRAEWNTPLGFSRNWVRETMAITDDGVPHLSLISGRCQHCDDAPCVSYCPSGASHKREDGIVLVDRDICSGCEMCVAVCPFDARFKNPVDNKISKCTFCQPRIDAGEQPACVDVCFNQALIFGDINDPNSEVSLLLKQQKWKKLVTDKVDTKPNQFYTESTYFDSSVLPMEKTPTIQAEVISNVVNPAVSVGVPGMLGLVGLAGIVKIIKRREEVSNDSDSE
jgi:tetrathionate reductase subunit B